MLQQSMSVEDIQKEVYQDLSAVVFRLVALASEYKKERKKKGIHPKVDYPKAFRTTTRNNNNWIITLRKPPADNKYKGEPSVCCFTYLETGNGLRVLQPMANPITGWYSGIAAYEPQVFSKYSESKKLNLLSPVEIVEDFFCANGFADLEIKREGEKIFSVGIAPDGFLIGEVQNGMRWIVQQRFIPNHELDANQNEVKSHMIESLNNNIKALLNGDEFDKTEFMFFADIAKAVA